MSQFDFSQVDSTLHEACKKESNKIPCKVLYNTLEAVKLRAPVISNIDIDVQTVPVLYNILDDVTISNLIIATNEKWDMCKYSKVHTNYSSAVSNFFK